jgi:hypothetical protein
MSDVSHYPRSSYCKASLQMINVHELSERLCCAATTTKHVQVVEVLEHPFLLFSLAYLCHLLLNVANCLLGHHCVIALVDRDRTIVREDLRECRPSCITSSAAIYSHQLNSLVTHSRKERF